MSFPVAFIVNPRSHNVRRKGSVLESVAPGVANAETIVIHDFEKLPEQIAGLAQRGVRAIFVEGGDGTLQAVLSACFAQVSTFNGLPEVAVLPGGSTNLAHKVCGLRLQTAEQITAFIARLRHDSASVSRLYQPALRIESSALPHPAIGMLLSTGSLARVMLFAQRELHGEGARGARTVANTAVRFLISPEHYLDQDGKPLLRASHFVANSHGFRIQGDHALSVMTTLPRLTLRLWPFWGKGQEAIALTHAEWPIRGLRAAFLKIIAGWTGPQMVRHGLSSHRADQIDLIYKGPLMLDGELLPVPVDGRVKVSVSAPISFLR